MDVYQYASDFKKRYPKTIAWRIKKHCDVVEAHIGPDEVVKYAFACQKNPHSYEIFRTFVIVVTDKRIIVAQKRLLFGYLFISVTPDLYNHLRVIMGIIWGKLCIDTVKEVIMLSNIDKDALPEIETTITQMMMDWKEENARD